jgi:hypothetical protein
MQGVGRSIYYLDPFVTEREGGPWEIAKQLQENVFTLDLPLLLNVGDCYLT